MKKSTNFELMDELMVAPTPGLDGIHGLVKVIAVTVMEGVPRAYEVDAYLSGDPVHDADVSGGAWYGFRYIDENKDWGLCYLPEELFQTMVDAAKN